MKLNLITAIPCGWGYMYTLAGQKSVARSKAQILSEAKRLFPKLTFKII